MGVRREANLVAFMQAGADSAGRVGIRSAGHLGAGVIGGCRSVQARSRRWPDGTRIGAVSMVGVVRELLGHERTGMVNNDRLGGVKS